MINGVDAAHCRWASFERRTNTEMCFQFLLAARSDVGSPVEREPRDVFGMGNERSACELVQKIYIRKRVDFCTVGFFLKICHLSVECVKVS